MGAEVSDNWEDEQLPVVLVVVPWSRLGSGRELQGGDLMRVVLDGMEGCRWAITGTLRCPVLGKRTDVPGAVHRNCLEGHLPQECSELNPKVIVLMGQESCNAFLGSAAPKKFQSALRRTIRGAEGWPPILVGRSPFYHDPDDDRDAFDEWVELFSRAEKMANGVDLGASFPYEEVSDVVRALEVCRALPSGAETDADFIWDTEYDGHEDDPKRRSYWFEGSENLCWSVEWLDAEGKQHTVTFIPPAANDPRVWEAAFGADRRPCAHFAKVDFQEPYATAGIDLFPIAKRLETGELDYRDPGQEIHLCDQSKAGLGILSLAMDKLGAENWKQKKDDLIDVENRRLAAQWQAVGNWVTRQGEAWAPVLEWEELEEKRQDKLVVAEHGATEKRRSNARMWLVANPPTEKPPNPPKPPEPDKPPGTAGFKAAIPYLYHYCAEDSYWTGNILRHYVPQVKAELGGCGPTVTRLLSRALELTCEVERIGLPVNMDRVAALQEHLTEVQRQAKLDMLQHARVRDAVCSLANTKLELARGRDPLEVSLEMLNTGSPLFRLAFAREQGVDLEEHVKRFKTDAGEPSFGKAALAYLTQPAIEWEDADETVRLWRAFSKLKQARDLYTKTKMFRFVERGYVRTDYRVVKVTAADHQGGSEGDSQGTGTGRLSAGFLQGLQKNEAFRSVFEAPPGYVFLEVDFATLEPRILAHLCGITEWQVWFERGYDLYCGMANQMLGLGVDVDHHDHKAVARELKACISDQYRNKTMKPCFLAQMYMQGYQSLAVATGMPVETTQKFSEDFHRAFPQLKKFQGILWQNMLAGLPVTTPFGRQSYTKLPSPNDPDRDSKLASELRHNWNLPVQATGSDCLIWLAWRVKKQLQAAQRWGGPVARVNGVQVPIEVIERKTGVQTWGAFCNLVHDAVWAVVKVEHFKPFARMLIDGLECRDALPFRLTSPLKAEPKAGVLLSGLKEVNTETLELTEEMLAR